MPLRPRLDDLIALGLGALALGPAIGHALPLWDLGELCFFAERLVAGAVPGRDFVVNAYGPGQPLILAALWTVLGASFAGVWALFLVQGLGLFVVTHRLAGRLLQGPVRWLPVLALTAAPGPLHKGFFGLGASLLGLVLLDLRGGGPAWRSGLILAAVGFFRLDLGAWGLLLGFVVLGSGRRLRRDGLTVVVPSLILVVASLLVLGLLDPSAPAVVLRQIVADVVTNERVPWPRMPGFADLASASNLDPWLLWAPAPIVGLWAASVWRRRDGTQAVLIALLVLVLNQVRIKPDLSHLLQTGPLLWVALAVLVPGRLWISRFATIAVPAVLFVQTLAFHPGDPYVGGMTIGWGRDRLIVTALGRAWVNPGEWERIQPALRTLSERVPAGPLWTPGYEPLFLAMSGRPPASPVAGLLYVADDPAAQERILAALRAHPPAAVLLRDESIEGPSRRMEVVGRPFLTELDRGYELLWEHAGTQVFVPKEK